VYLSGWAVFDRTSGQALYACPANLSSLPSGCMTRLPRIRLAPGYGIVADTWFEYALSTLLVSIAVTT